MINRLTALHGASGHNETLMNYGYDSDTLCVDVEVYKYVAMQMLHEEGVDIYVNTMVAEVLTEGSRITGVVIVNHQAARYCLPKWLLILPDMEMCVPEQVRTIQNPMIMQSQTAWVLGA